MKVYSQSQGRLIDVPDAPGMAAQTPLPSIQQQPQSFTEKAGGALLNIGKSIVNPFWRTGRNIIGTGLALGALATNRKGGEQGALEKAARYVLPKMSVEDPRKAGLQQVQDSLNVMSYAVPFGKAKAGAGALSRLATKSLLPGAAVGSLQSLSQADLNNPEKALKETIGGAATGAIGAGLLHGGSKVLGKVGRFVEKSGTETRSGVSKIYVKSDIAGASKEKAIQKTLDDLNILGNAQKKYEMLEPRMSEMNNKISSILSKDNKVFNSQEIKNNLISNLKDSIRRKEILPENAIQEVDGYIKSLMGDAGTIDSVNLYNLKKQVNGDFGAVARKIKSKMPLNDTDYVIAKARQTLDDVLAKAHPDVKRLTTQESHLYDAAESLGRSRKTVPTVRAAGFTLPAGKLQTAQDVLGAGLQKTGQIATGIGERSANPLASQVSGQVSARLPSLPNFEQPSDQQQNSIGSEQSGNAPYDQSNHQQEIIPQKTLSGYTPEQIAAGYQKALSAGDKKSAEYLYSMLERETKYQSSINAQPKAGTPLTQAQTVLVKGGMRNLDQIKRDFGIYDNSGRLIGLKLDKMKKSTLTGGVIDPQYRSMAEKVIMAVIRPESGAAIPPAEMKSYLEAYLPTWKDTPESALYKIQDLERRFADYGLQ